MAACCAFASLPHALVLRVFASLPVHARLRCAEVCRAWRAAVDDDDSLWQRVDLSATGGVSPRLASDRLLAAAVAKAGARLRSLDVSGAYLLSRAALLAAVAAAAATLQELRLSREGEGLADTEQLPGLAQLCRAAPQLRALHAAVTCFPGQTHALLRCERPYGPVRPWLLHHTTPGRATEEETAQLAQDVAAAHESLTALALTNARLHSPAALDAVVDAALARRLTALEFVNCGLRPAAAPSLARLLGGGALRTLRIQGEREEPLLDAPAARLLGDALRDSRLASLTLADVGLWDTPRAALALLQALVGHPTLRALALGNNLVAPAHRAAAGAALAALLTARGSGLDALAVAGCGLGDAGLGPLFDALAADCCRLRSLDCVANGLSATCARAHLLPAVRANRSLRALSVELQGDTHVHRSLQLVRRRST
jgi:hypothetical protein